jgi:Zn-dependent protease
MLRLLALPIDLLRIALYTVYAFVDAARGRKRQRFETTILINAPRDAVWRLTTADQTVLKGPPVMEITRERVPDSSDLWLTRIAVSGQPRAQAVSREIERDEQKGILRAQMVAHELSMPPEGGRDSHSGMTLVATPQGTVMTTYNELNVLSIRDRIVYPLGSRRMAQLIKAECEAQAGTHNRLVELANHALVLSVVALASFWYLFGLKIAGLLSLIVAVHEAGHVAAMLMVGVGVRGIYLIPFFGGAVVPKTAYRTEGRLGFIALMGPAMSLVPTFALMAMLPATGKSDLRLTVQLFAFINASNLLPIYPLDGGLILNALIGSVSRKVALIVGWIGVLAGLVLAIYLQSFLIGVPLLLVALQRYLAGHQTIQLQRLSLASGTMLAAASLATFVAYIFVIKASSEIRPFKRKAELTQEVFISGITPPSASVSSAAMSRTALPNSPSRASVMRLVRPEIETAASGSAQSLKTTAATQRRPSRASSSSTA